MRRGLSGLAIGALLLAGCKPAPAPEPAQNQTANMTEPASPAPAPAATAAAIAASPLAQWLVGSWSYDTSCSTDMMLHFNADGSLQNNEDSGSWSLAGDAVTETLTERFEMGSDAPVKLSPPEKRTYTVARIDDARGSITFQGKKIAIQRC